MAKIWVGVRLVRYSGIGGGGVIASTSLAEIGRGIGCSVWTLRGLKRKYGEGGFEVDGVGNGGVREPWYVIRVEWRKVEGRGKDGKSGYRLKSKG